MGNVYEWRDAAGNLTASLEVVVWHEDPNFGPGHSSYSTDLTRPGRREYRAWVYTPVGGTVAPEHERAGFVFHCTGSRAGCIEFVNRHLPLVSATAALSLTMRIARDEAMDWPDSLRPGVRERLERRSVELFGQPDHHDILVLLTPDDLMPGYTFELFWAASRWRSSSHDLKQQLAFIEEFRAGTVTKTRVGEVRLNIQFALETLDSYYALRQDATPEDLRQYAIKWNRSTDMPGDTELFAARSCLLAYQALLPDGSLWGSV